MSESVSLILKEKLNLFIIIRINGMNFNSWQINSYSSETQSEEKKGREKKVNTGSKSGGQNERKKPFVQETAEKSRI